jgi:hypothetical protein
MTSTPQNAPQVEHRPGACAAWGCPLDGTIKTGSDWVCGCHHGALTGAWQEVTRRLNERKPIIKSMLLAQRFKPHEWKARQAGAAAAMRKLGREDLVPRRFTVLRKVYDRHTGGMVDREQILDELDFVGLWVTRLGATLARECGDATPQPQQPATIAAGAKPGDEFGSFLPAVATVPQFIVDPEEIE